MLYLPAGRRKAVQLSATNMTRDKNEIVEDGADEKMLSADEKEQLAHKDEVKFIPANDRSNGDAKIEIGRIDKVCITGRFCRSFSMVASHLLDDWVR